MRTLTSASLSALALIAFPPLVHAQDEWGSPIPEDLTVAEEGAPSERSPPPSEQPPSEPESVASSAAAPAGQWVYTAQYGWVWMPYSAAYVYAPTTVAQPYMFLYGPEFGWAWVGAPWVWGWGPSPHFGLHGGFRFGWRYPGYAWSGWGHPRWYSSGRGFGPRGFGSRGGWHGTAPAPPRAFAGPRAGGGGPRVGAGPRGGGGGPRGGGRR
jgi:hypothetical protein